MGLVWDDFSPEEQEQIRREKAAQQLVVGGSTGGVPGTRRRGSGGGDIFNATPADPEWLSDQKERFFNRATLAERYAYNQGWDGTREGAKNIDWNAGTGFTEPVIYGGPNAGKNPFEVPSNQLGGQAPPTPPVQWGGGQQPGVAPVEPPVGGGGGSLPNVEQIGFEGYSPETRDFYRQQFQTMRQRKAGEDQKEMAAALRRMYPGPAPEATDPWSWAGGEDQFTPRVVDWSPDGGNYTWNRRSGIESGMTNREIADYLFNQNIVSPEHQAIMRQHFNNPDVPDRGWLQYSSPEQMKQMFATNHPNASPEFLDALSAIADNMYIRSDLASTGGPAAVPGYAAPITGG